MDLVHRPWTSARHGPWWTNHHGRSWSSSELGLAATPGHGGLPRGGEKDEELTGVRFWASPKTERHRRDGSTMAMVGGTKVLMRGLGVGVADALR
jgi:hypothetical protein